MAGTRRSSTAIALAVLALATAGCSSPPATPFASAPRQQNNTDVTHVGAALARGRAGGSKDLYIGNIGGGVLLYSTGKNPHQVGDITSQVPRVTDVWVDHAGVLYAYNDNAKYPYETIEEFQPGAQSPFFSLVVQRYGSIVAADAQQNVYADGSNSSGQKVIDVYPPGSQKYTSEYVVPTLGRVSSPQGMAFDSTGALLVGVAALANNRQGQIGGVFRLDAHSGTFVNLNLQKAYGGLIAIDAAQNLYVGGARFVSVYAPGATTPSRVLHPKADIVALTVASDGTLYVATYNGGITVYRPGRVRSQSSFAPQAQEGGLALGPG